MSSHEPMVTNLDRYVRATVRASVLTGCRKDIEAAIVAILDDEDGDTGIAEARSNALMDQLGPTLRDLAVAEREMDKYFLEMEFGNA